MTHMYIKFGNPSTLSALPDGQSINDDDVYTSGGDNNEVATLCNYFHCEYEYVWQINKEVFAHGFSKDLIR